MQNYHISSKLFFWIFSIFILTLSCEKKETAADVTPPIPDPMSWSVKPIGIGSTAISMTATTVDDPGGVEYYFEALTEGGHSSEWQTASVYVDEGLVTGETYTYRVKARDLSGNETAFSDEASATPSDGGRKPIITGDMLASRGENINGPSLIRIPDWILPEDRADPSANYYLYFANHEDTYIRMAWAANVMGPYTIYNDGAGVLNLNSINEKGTHLSAQGHIASPDVHVDDENKQIIMYYHGGLKWDGIISNVGQGQYTGVVTSTNGLDFNNGIVDMIICEFYARVFSYGGELYAFATEGKLYKAQDPKNPWVNPPPGQGEVDILANGGLWEFISGFNPWDNIGGPFDAFDAKLRHNSVLVKGDIVEIYYSRYFQTPERIEFSTIDFSQGIYNLAASSPVTVIEPEYAWEGADLPLEESGIGSATGVRQLRDPFIFKDIDGTEYLLYSGRGEEAIGIVLLSDVMP